MDNSAKRRFKYRYGISRLWKIFASAVLLSLSLFSLFGVFGILFGAIVHHNGRNAHIAATLLLLSSFILLFTLLSLLRFKIEMDDSILKVRKLFDGESVITISDFTSLKSFSFGFGWSVTVIKLIDTDGERKRYITVFGEENARLLKLRLLRLFKKFNR